LAYSRNKSILPGVAPFEHIAVAVLFVLRPVAVVDEGRVAQVVATIVEPFFMDSAVVEDLPTPT
jgi:hypothetical protein